MTSLISVRRNRQSNLELLRCLAMFFILLVHACYFTLGIPDHITAQTKPLDSFTQMFLESLSIVGVDVFVLISGWFGIHPKLKSITNFIFQCLFFSVGIYIVALISGISNLTIKHLAELFYLLKINWFIKAYIGLYIVAPLLNTFIEHSSRRLLEQVLLWFYIFQTIYGWFSGGAFFFEQGYSTHSFVGLYLLARYIRLYTPKWSTLPKRIDLIVYATLTVVLSIMCFSAIYSFDAIDGSIGKYVVGGVIRLQTSYISPAVIVASVALLLFFSKLSLSSMFINWMGASTFAVFLIHANTNVIPYFQDFIRSMHNGLGYFEYYVYIFLFLLVVFFASIFLDQIRIITWQYIWPVIERLSGKKSRAEETEKK